MSAKKTVIRKYSVKRLLLEREEWEQLKLKGELEEAWGLGYSHTNKLINSIQDKGPSLSAEQVLKAAELLGVSMEEIMTPYHDEARATAKI